MDFDFRTRDLSVDIGALHLPGDAAEPKRPGKQDGLVRQMARERIREDAREKRLKILRGEWPGYAASVQDPERGGWHAVVLLNRGDGRYIRRQSFATFATSDEAYSAAESWLCREAAKS